jgi:hypothetical protein
VGLLERAVKRYTCLAPLVLPPLLAALAKLPSGAAVSCGLLLHVRCSLFAATNPPNRGRPGSQMCFVSSC